MIKVTLIALGKLKENYLRDACEEYRKRLSRYCSLSILELNPVSLPDNPSHLQIESALKKEAEQIFSKIPEMETPGHSEGSVTLICEDALFTGDTLFRDSCGRTDFVGGSMRKMMASLKRLAQLEGNPAVLPGHMETSDLDTERRRNPYVLQALRSNAE